MRKPVTPRTSTSRAGPPPRRKGEEQAKPILGRLLLFWGQAQSDWTCEGRSWCCIAVQLPSESRLQAAQKFCGLSRQRPTLQTTACHQAYAESRITVSQAPCNKPNGLQVCRGRGAGRLAKERHRA